MSEMNLDRSFGLFSGMGAAALAEGVENARNFSHSCAIGRKNDKINDLLDEVEGLEDNIDHLKKAYKKLFDQHKILQAASSQDIVDYNSLADRFNQLQEDYIAKDSDNQALNKRIQALKFESSENIENIQEVSSAEKKAANASFAVLYKNVNTGKQQVEFSLKVAYTQNKIRAEFIEKIIGMGLIPRVLFEDHFRQSVLTQNDLDEKRQGISYGDSFSWIKSHHKSMYEKLKVLE